MKRWVIEDEAGGAGGFAVGYELGKVAAGGEMNEVMFGGGLLLIVSSYYLDYFGKKKTYEAVRNYNQRVRVSFENKRSPQFRFASRGIGIALQF